MSDADIGQRPATIAAGIKTQRGSELLDRDIRATGIGIEIPSILPTDGVARVQIEGSLDEPESGFDVFAEPPKHKARPGEDKGVVGGLLQRLPGGSECARAVCRGSSLQLLSSTMR